MGLVYYNIFSNSNLLETAWTQSIFHDFKLYEIYATFVIMACNNGPKHNFLYLGKNFLEQEVN